MIEMRIVGVRVEMPTQQPILMLTEVNGPRSLPILIGSAEATAIAMHQQGVRPPRPLTHDLLGNVIAALGRSVTQVRVVDFREGTFFGELAFGLPGRLRGRAEALSAARPLITERSP
jgi:bifunctional DNase/RNase